MRMTMSETDASGRKDYEPHPSHTMTKWRNTIVTLLETSRFGSIRECTACGAEHAKTAAGEAHHDELDATCVGERND